MWYFPMRLKSDLYAIFRQFQTLVERQFSCSIKTVQSDLGGEYRKLHHFLADLGIAHRQSCAYMHEQNGRVECKHRHIVETGLALLAQGSVPSRYLDYAFETAVFLINRLPTPVLGNVSPHFVLFRSLPDYSFLRVFRCLCFPYLRPYNKHNMDYRSSRCVFLGYPSSFGGYLCVDLNTGKMFICRHVRFDESVYPLQCSFVQVSPPAAPSSLWSVSRMVSSVSLSSEAPLVVPVVPVAPVPQPSPCQPAVPPQRTHLMVTRNMARATAYGSRAFVASVDVVEPTCYT